MCRLEDGMIVHFKFSACYCSTWQKLIIEYTDVYSNTCVSSQGLALTDMKSMPPVIWHFPVLALPQDPAERFDRLFATREKWTRDELEPFIQ